MKYFKHIDQKKFESTIQKFKKIEDARDDLWDRARKLIDHGFEIEAYILILATWNFARFRYFVKKFKLEKFKSIIHNTNPIFARLKHARFETIDFSDTRLVNDIKTIYSELKKVAEQTGA